MELYLGEKGLTGLHILNYLSIEKILEENVSKDTTLK